MLKYSVIILIIGIMSACSTTNNKPMVSIENDPRIGEEVKKACSIRHIRGWDQVDNDRNALIVTLSHNKAYKLSLTGGCQADWAIFAIGIENKTGSHCITKFDRLYTDSQDFKGMHCTISKIQEWYPERLTESDTK